MKIFLAYKADGNMWSIANKKRTSSIRCIRYTYMNFHLGILLAFEGFYNLLRSGGAGSTELTTYLRLVPTSGRVLQCFARIT